MNETPPAAESAEQQLSPAERVAKSMADIGSLIQDNFLTEAQRVAFATEIEIHIDPQGEISFPNGPGYSETDKHRIAYHAYRFQAAGEPAVTEWSVKLHTPQTSFHDYEYTYDHQTREARVQRGGENNDKPHLPQREDDAAYAESLEASLRRGIEKVNSMFGSVDDDDTVGLVEYEDPLTQQRDETE